jgi:topoisomerase-4 subunit A
LGEFFDGDQLLIILDNGEYYLTNFDVNNHFEDNLRIIEKYDANKVWTAVLFDADNDNYPYIKRFLLEASKKKQTYMGENAASREILLTDQVYPRVLITFGGADAVRPPQEIDVEQFIAVKGYKAKGKRLTTWQVERIEELEPLRFPEPEEDTEDNDTPADTEEESLDPDAGKSEQQIIDEMTGQLNLFPDE